MAWEKLMRSDKTKDHAIQEYLETFSQYSILVQLGGCPGERSSNFAKILPNSNALTAIPTGKWASSIAAVEET